MLRVINQEEARAIADAQFHLHGAGKKGEKYRQFLRRAGWQLTTPEPGATRQEAERTINTVKQRLGRFYRPARIKA